jgi:threonine dehydratase
MIKPTTVITSVRLNRLLGLDVTLASETFQHTGNFKFRGAWHMASNVPNTHLITSSSGNFGQAIAFACQLLKKRCTVVMPHDSVAAKVDAVREFGAEIDFVDVSEKSRADRVAELARKFPDAYIASGYDDDLMIAGNSTLGKELAQLASCIDVIVTPVSGGGLASGIITGLRAKGVNTPVIGAEPLLADHVTRSLRAGRLIEDDYEAKTIADGARTNGLGVRNWQILKDGLADVVAVSEETIGEALRVLFTLANLKVEPTGALSLGALLANPERFHSQRVCCVVSGGNVDEETYANLLLQPSSTVSADRYSNSYEKVAERSWKSQ